jgi:hypothetical protein
MIANLFTFILAAEISQDPAWAPGTVGGGLRASLDSWVEYSSNGNILIKLLMAGPIFGLRIVMIL